MSENESRLDLTSNAKFLAHSAVKELGNIFCKISIRQQKYIDIESILSKIPGLFTTKLQ